MDGVGEYRAGADAGVVVLGHNVHRLVCVVARTQCHCAHKLDPDGGERLGGLVASLADHVCQLARGEAVLLVRIWRDITRS
jgi:hypothetical protein